MITMCGAHRVAWGKKGGHSVWSTSGAWGKKGGHSVWSTPGAWGKKGGHSVWSTSGSRLGKKSGMASHCVEHKG